MKFSMIFSLAYLIILSCQCSSLIFTPIAINEDSPGYDAVYAGTKMNHAIIFNDHHPHNPISGQPFTALASIDYPLSLILDTVLLPITLPVAIFTDKTNSPEGDS